jgi:hypothetical protein
MKNKKFKINKLTDKDKEKLLSNHRIKVLAKYIERKYIQNEVWGDRAGKNLSLIIHMEIIRGLNDEFEFLRDDPMDPLIVDLIDKKTKKIVKLLKNKPRMGLN